MDFKFFDEVHDFQRFVKENIRLLGNYLVISEQLYLKNNETGIIDMLVLDNSSKKLIILELKNELTTDKNVWQPLRYYDLVRRGEDSFKKLLSNPSLNIDYDIEDIDLNPKLILVVPECNEQLLRVLSYFNDIDSEVIELKREINNYGVEIKKKNYKPISIFHKEDLVEVQNKISKTWSFEEYLSHGINRDKILLAKKISNQIESIFHKKGFKFDIFFTESKVTITKNDKVWGHLFIKQRILDHKLTVSFKVSKDFVFNNKDYVYNSSIDSFNLQKSSIKITLLDQIDSTIIENLL